MAEYPDLSPFVYDEAPLAMTSIGWLGGDSEFPGGSSVTERQFERIQQEAKRSRSLALGLHDCELCPAGEPARGTGEIHIFGVEGTTYCAPAMIAHYVRDHGYTPPAEFLAALTRTGSLDWDDRAEVLVSLLVSDRAEPGWRDAAAIDIANWHDGRALEALLVAGLDDHIVDYSGRSIGVSIAEFWGRAGAVDDDSYLALLPQVQWGVLTGLGEGDPELAEGLFVPPEKFNY